ncbi:MAG: GNAT family N-acetyltransferase [Pseudomonadota bacterium]
MTAVKDLRVAPRVGLRPAAPADESLVLGWRNDPFIIARGSSRASVSREDHRAWFAASLAGDDRLLLIVEIDGVPAGLVRFDRAGRDAVISIYLVEAYTGRGHGILALHRAVAMAAERWRSARITAVVRADNVPGHKAFRKAGFRHGPGPPGHVSFVRRMDGESHGPRSA